MSASTTVPAGRGEWYSPRTRRCRRRQRASDRGKPFHLPPGARMSWPRSPEPERSVRGDRSRAAQEASRHRGAPPEGRGGAYQGSLPGLRRPRAAGRRRRGTVLLVLDPGGCAPGNELRQGDLLSGAHRRGSPSRPATTRCRTRTRGSGNGASLARAAIPGRAPTTTATAPGSSPRRTRWTPSPACSTWASQRAGATRRSRILRRHSGRWTQRTGGEIAGGVSDAGRSRNAKLADTPRGADRLPLHRTGRVARRRLWPLPVLFTVYVSLWRWRIRRDTFIGLQNYVGIFGAAGPLLLFLLAMASIVAGFVLLRRRPTLHAPSPRPRRAPECRGSSAGAAALVAGTILVVLSLPAMYGVAEKEMLDSLRVTIWYSLAPCRSSSPRHSGAPRPRPEGAWRVWRLRRSTKPARSTPWRAGTGRSGPAAPKCLRSSEPDEGVAAVSSTSRAHVTR